MADIEGLLEDPVLRSPRTDHGDQAKPPIDGLNRLTAGRVPVAPELGAGLVADHPSRGDRASVGSARRRGEVHHVAAGHEAGERKDDPGAAPCRLLHVTFRHHQP